MAGGRRRRAAAAMLVTTAFVWSVVTAAEADAPPSATAAIASGPSAFRPLPPTRVLDTRDGTGVPAGKPAAGSVTVLTIAGVAGVSAGASAVVLNVTATDATLPGFVQVFPTGGGTPGTTSNLNVEEAGGTIANMVVVKVGAGGAVGLYTQNGAHLVADVLGFFEPAAVARGGRFVALPTPHRLVDTRDPATVPIANPGDAMDCGSFATWAEANEWYWTYARYGDPARLDGNDNDSIPCESLPGAPSQPIRPTDLFRLGASGSLRAPVTTTSALPGGVVPPGASAVVLNLTATDAAVGFLQIVPTGGTTAFGASSNLNVTAADRTAPNLAVVPIGSDGTVTVYSQTGAHIVLDVAGYFTGPGDELSTDGLFVPVDPSRLLDTRDGTGAPSGKLGAGGLVELHVAGLGGVPAQGASAVFLNTTMTDAVAPGFVQVYPTAQGTPGATSNLNVERPGQTRPNAVFSGLGSGGRVSLYTQSGGHLVGDLGGWFTAGAAVTTPSAPSGPAGALLAGLTIAPQDYNVGYHREDWGYPGDLDGDCQDTRDEVLIRDAIAPITYTMSGCSPVSSVWVDSYSGLAFPAANLLEVDHVVPLAVAHRAGGALWPPAKKAAFANDVVGPELRAVEAAVNQAKGDSTPDAWLPPDVTAHCGYATDWIRIKAQWGLTVTQAEHDTLLAIIAGC